ncbi:hypothetical protein H1P_2340001 [Hyella patelloides LEGE 07179]|uniref:Uncharacterized protein n=1 Tax=Hyella patelloides LEGE 07179 TaxID=945734 RepID=A0A563VRK2_9CYAN|nr:hypothetical protein H1P_2340001 [Hyella patelloides LEGE 07179]
MIIILKNRQHLFDHLITLNPYQTIHLGCLSPHQEASPLGYATSD